MTLNLQSHPPPPKPRRPTPCHRHPDQPLNPICAPCLRERLSLLNPSSSLGVGAAPSSSSAALPELRRCRTFSGDKCESLGFSCEPRRRSCEVRARSTLEDLFTVDDEGGGAASIAEFKVESKNLGLLGGTFPVPELREEEDEESDCEIRVSADVIVPDYVSMRAGDLNVEEGIEDSKTMREFIDLEFKSNKPVRRDFKEIAGSFWIAASVFSRKLQKWKRKQKSERSDGDCDKARHGGVGGAYGWGELRLKRLSGRRFRDAQSEVGEYGFGRRSCDTDPRVSIDLRRASIDGGRISVDGIGKRFFDTDPRLSLDLGRASVDCGRITDEESRRGCFDAPRASWDGYMNGRSLSRGSTPMISVIENAMATVYGYDSRTLVSEKSNVKNDDRKSVGGARHLDSVSLIAGRKSIGHCSSKRNEMLIHEENSEAHLLSRSVMPPGAVDIFHGTKLLITEKELMDSRMSSLKDDSSDSCDTTSKDMASSTSSSSNSTRFNKSRKWGKFLNIWGLLSRQKQYKSAEEEKFNTRNVNQSIADPSKKTGREADGEEASSGPKWKLVRSQSVASSRSLYTMAGSALDEAKSLRLKKHEAVVSERNLSARFLPNSTNNGMLHFYLTPSRASRLDKNRLNKSHSLARSVLKR